MKILTPALKFYLTDPINRIIYIAISVIIVATFIGVVILMPDGDNIPLHYNVYFGIDFIGSSNLAFTIPVAMMVLTIINSIIGLMIWRHDRIIGYFMSSGTLFINIVAALAIGLIINVAQ